ncbi:unnamed protein product [Ilex paraguariensis]|uniref:Uncharacterized protein n=1 Tax=Ilex paraguariensis TaxID=185542 RepID=A0ABC8U4G6_9AQUA
MSGFDLRNRSGVVAVARQRGTDVVLDDEFNCETPTDLTALPYFVSEGPDGYLLIDVPYLGGVRSYTPSQVLGKVFSDLKSIAKKHHDADVVDCYVGILVYFADHQREAVMDAATNAGLHPLHWHMEFIRRIYLRMIN